jgi:hypothetical protein
VLVGIVSNWYQWTRRRLPPKRQDSRPNSTIKSRANTRSFHQRDTKYHTTHLTQWEVRNSWYSGGDPSLKPYLSGLSSSVVQVRPHPPLPLLFLISWYSGMLNAIQGIGAGGSRASETSLVAKGNAALYSCFAIFGIFSGSVINKLGPKIPLMLYVLFVKIPVDWWVVVGLDMRYISVHYGHYRMVDLMDSSLEQVRYWVQQPPYYVRPSLDAAYFSLRSRALNSMMYWLFQMFGSFAISGVLDYKGWARRTRGLVGLS